MGSKKKLITSILFIVIAFAIITSFSYSYFTVNLSTSDFLNIATIFHNREDPVFTAYTDSNIITSTSVLESKSNSAADSVSASMIVELAGKGSKAKSSVTCLYDIYFEMVTKGYDTYIPSSGVNENNLKEFTLKITNNDVMTLKETQISKLKSGSHIVKDERITSARDNVKKVYQITSTLYNLGIEQNISHKKYKMIVKIDNPRCSGGLNE